MRSLRIIGVMLLLCMIAGVAYGASPKWILLPVPESDKAIYVDKANFSSNLKTKKKDDTYQVVYWLRQETLQLGTYFEYLTILQKEEKSGVVRYKTVASRYVGSDGKTITGGNHTGWERLTLEDPAYPTFVQIWKYDETKVDEKKEKSSKGKEVAK